MAGAMGKARHRTCTVHRCPALVGKPPVAHCRLPFSGHGAPCPYLSLIREIWPPRRVFIVVCGLLEFLLATANRLIISL